METVTPEQMAEIIRNEGGVIIPKRSFEIPEPDLIRITRITTDPRKAQSCLQDLQRFLREPATDDPFGSNHETRLDWAKTMFDKYGPAFIEYFRKHNQMRVNCHGSIPINIEMLMEEVASKGNFYLSRYIMNALKSREVSSFVGDAQTKQKVAYLHELEDLCLQILKIFAEPIVIPQDFLGTNLLELSDEEIELFLAEPTLQDSEIGQEFARKLMDIQRYRAYPNLFQQELIGPITFTN